MQPGSPATGRLAAATSRRLTLTGTAESRVGSPRGPVGEGGRVHESTIGRLRDRGLLSGAAFVTLGALVWAYPVSAWR